MNKNNNNNQIIIKHNNVYFRQIAVVLLTTITVITTPSYPLNSIYSSSNSNNINIVYGQIATDQSLQPTTTTAEEDCRESHIIAYCDGQILGEADCMKGYPYRGDDPEHTPGWRDGYKPGWEKAGCTTPTTMTNTTNATPSTADDTSSQNRTN